MKKTLFTLCALAALTACSNEGLELFQNNKSSDTAERIVGDFNGLKLNLTITLDNGTATKATVKDGFAVNDVIFVTLTGYHSSNKYIELKKTGASEWTATPKNDMDLSLYDKTGTMTAVYFPYGSSLVPYSSAGSIQFDDEEGGETVYYGGLFYQAENAAYTITNDDVLCGTLNMVAPPLTGGAYEDDLFIHFDISGYTSGHNYVLYQENVKPFRFTGINSEGTVVWTARNAGTSIQGYEDTANGIISFSGLLDASAVGTALEYQFSIIDWTDSIAYTRSAGSKTLSTSKYIGIGDISTSTWNAMEFVDMGTSGSNLYPIYWAKRNVGATADNGRDSYGKYFAWGDPNGYYLEDPWNPDPVNYPGIYLDVCTHNFNTRPVCDVDGDGNLLPAYDGAKATMKGFWRMPTEYDYMILTSNTSKTYSAGGATLTSTIDGYEGRHFFLPAAGTLEYDAGFWATFSRCWLSREGSVLSDPELDPSDPANYIDTFNGMYWTSTKAEIIFQGNPVDRPGRISLDTYLVEPDPVYRGRISSGYSSRESEFTVGRPIRAVFQVPE